MNEDIKVCEVCGQPYERRARESRARFRQRKACGRTCGAKLGSAERASGGPRGGYAPVTPSRRYLALLEGYSDLGLTITDISDELNINASTVRTALTRLHERGEVTFRFGADNDKLWMLSKYERKAA